MSRATNMAQKRKAAKRDRQRKDATRRHEIAAKKYREEQRASGMPADVFALHKLLCR